MAAAHERASQPEKDGGQEQHSTDFGQRRYGDADWRQAEDAGGAVHKPSENLNEDQPRDGCKRGRRKDKGTGIKPVECLSHGVFFPAVDRGRRRFFPAAFLEYAAAPGRKRVARGGFVTRRGKRR
ncbi:hypothetical protein GCM10011415_09860 [Salipiger pallidus]|uniref:Uncharacterized protein n=1 Tax=Salipiger pallidus TaxID=1775170 RepID=A0A8J2ZHK0_9RHOB|nr:hypothetical protein GCM10011415_09860 [Salipiger pallidus]